MKTHKIFKFTINLTSFYVNLFSGWKNSLLNNAKKWLSQSGATDDFGFPEFILSHHSEKVYFERSSIPKLGSSICEISYETSTGNDTKEIDVSSSNIKEITSDAFVKCQNLEIIVLRNNKIKILPQDVFNRNEKLVKIDLSCNLIEDLNSETFSELENLKELILSSNMLKIFPESLICTCLSLESIKLDSNDLFDFNLKKSLNKLINLKLISLNNNQLRRTKVKKIKSELEKYGIDIDHSYEGGQKERSYSMSNLPKLPVPDMEETLTEYLRILEPITTKHQYERTKAITKNFAAGLGPQLQQYLEDKREAEDNWV
uniref:CSON002014 protein n=1 Tax=Culicoides sonorensis TaxID=179676 RepID=A0A336MVS0_CULSO